MATATLDRVRTQQAATHGYLVCWRTVLSAQAQDVQPVKKVDTIDVGHLVNPPREAYAATFRQQDPSLIEMFVDVLSHHARHPCYYLKGKLLTLAELRAMQPHAHRCAQIEEQVITTFDFHVETNAPVAILVEDRLFNFSKLFPFYVDDVFVPGLLKKE